MNVGTYLLLTVPLVGVSLYVYDSVRGSSHAATSDVAPVGAPAPREASVAAPGPVLQGDTSVQTERIVRETAERMLKELLAKGGGAGGTGVISGGGSDAGLPAQQPLSLGSEPEAVEGPNARFDERTLKVFRAYLDEAQRLEREEREVKMVGDTLERLGVSLTDAQRKSVIDTTVRYQKQRREAFRNLQPGTDNREARQQAGKELRDAYSKAIYDLVPSAEAEKIVNGIGGFFRGADGGGPQGGFAGRGAGGGGRIAPGDGGSK